MPVALTGGALIDGTGAPPVPRATLVIDGDRIAAVSGADSAEVPAGAEVLDVTGKTIVPGLINTHTHLCWDCVGDLKEQSHFDSPTMVALKYAMNMRHCLQAGVTTIRDMGAPYGIAHVATQAVAGGIVAGPRVFHSGRPLSITSGHAFWMGTVQADGIDGVRKAVREEVGNGASWIKIMASGSREEGLTHKGTVWTNSFPEFSMSELEVAVEEAHAAGKRITAHATETRAIRNCVQAGFDGIEHGGDIDPETLELMAANGVWLVPTLSPANLQVERGAEIGMPEFEIERRRGQIAESNEETVRAARAGVRMAMGTDAGSPAVPNHEVAREIELLVESGAVETAMEALVIATRNGAELLGVGDRLGTLEPGKMADVVVVAGDPLERLGALRDVELVFLGGEQVVRDGVVLK
jgi:imidazolonepropionase-like amidohydrolase